MKLYLLKLLQNNDEKEIMNEDFVGKTKEFGANLYLLDNLELAKYLVAFAFKDYKKRDEFADTIQHLAFEYEDLEYPDELMEKVENGTLYAEKPKWHKKPNFCEHKIEAWAERNMVTFKKEYKDSIYYNFDFDGAVICLDYRARFILGGRKNAKLRIAKQPKAVEPCLYDILKDFEKYLEPKVTD